MSRHIDPYMAMKYQKSISIIIPKNIWKNIKKVNLNV